VNRVGGDKKAAGLRAQAAKPEGRSPSTETDLIVLLIGFYALNEHINVVQKRFLLSGWQFFNLPQSALKLGTLRTTFSLGGPNV
jgi:hypothetical protein